MAKNKIYEEYLKINRERENRLWAGVTQEEFMEEDSLSLVSKSEQVSGLISSIFFSKQNNLWKYTGSPKSVVPTRIHHSESPQQPAFHTWTFNLSISWNSRLLPIHQMTTIIVILSPLKSLITLTSEDPTHQELEDPAELGLPLYDLIYVK